ncbi:MAG: DUF4388 domain-containing protein [Sandaracinaceae bacterium]|nr:DUF4388 domain-containing protein [Sandaracinaceae bacterium]
MSPSEKRLLYASTAEGRDDELLEALHERGYAITAVEQGMEIAGAAVEFGANLILIDASLDVLDIRLAIDLLKNHPRTEEAEIYVMGSGELGHIAAIDSRARPIVKPRRIAELIAIFEAALEKRFSPGEAVELRGELSQVSLFDLLQVFAANKRTGLLRLEGERLAGEIGFADGRVVHAVQGYASGEKAFYRLLALSEGRFVFRPDRPAGGALDSSVDALLMEGVRHLDETRKIVASLPREHARYRSVLGELELPPLAQALNARLEIPHLRREILDLFDSTDLEILEMLALLLETGVVEVDEASMNLRLYADESEELALRAGILRLRREGLSGIPRLGLIGHQLRELNRFVRTLELLPEFIPPAVAPLQLEEWLFGELGRIRVGGIELELYAIPDGAISAPLIGTLLGGSRRALSFGDGERVREFSRLLDLELIEVGKSAEQPVETLSLLRTALGLDP